MYTYIYIHTYTSIRMRRQLDGASTRHMAQARGLFTRSLMGDIVDIRRLMARELLTHVNDWCITHVNDLCITHVNDWCSTGLIDSARVVLTHVNDSCNTAHVNESCNTAHVYHWCITHVCHWCSTLGVSHMSSQYFCISEYWPPGCAGRAHSV